MFRSMLISFIRSVESGLVSLPPALYFDGVVKLGFQQQVQLVMETLRIVGDDVFLDMLELLACLLYVAYSRAEGTKPLYFFIVHQCLAILLVGFLDLNRLNQRFGDI